jgi:CRP-like cAMP-binding protein
MLDSSRSWSDRAQGVRPLLLGTPDWVDIRRVPIARHLCGHSLNARLRVHMSNHVADQIRPIPIFSALDDAGLADVAALATEFEAPKGHVLVEHGQAGTGVFIIEDGEVRVDRPHGEHVDLGPGAFFGELAVLAEVPRTARVSAITDLRCLAISRNDMVELLDRRPEVAVSMLRDMAHRLAEAT